MNFNQVTIFCSVSVAGHDKDRPFSLLIMEKCQCQHQSQLDLIKAVAIIARQGK